MSIHYFDFCLSGSFVTHGADSTAVTIANYPTTADGYTFGVVTTGPNAAADRDAGNPSHLASIWYRVNNIAVAVWQLDLAPGQYKIGCALGDQGGAAGNQQMVVKDGGTTLLTVTGNNTSANEYIDASGTLLTAANWEADQVPQTVTLAGSSLTFEFGGAGGSDYTAWASISIEPVVAGVVFTQLERITRGINRGIRG